MEKGPAELTASRCNHTSCSYPPVAGVLLEELPELVEEDVARGFTLEESKRTR